MEVWWTMEMMTLLLLIYPGSGSSGGSAVTWPCKAQLDWHAWESREEGCLHWALRDQQEFLLDQAQEGPWFPHPCLSCLLTSPNWTPGLLPQPLQCCPVTPNLSPRVHFTISTYSPLTNPWCLPYPWSSCGQANWGRAQTPLAFLGLHFFRLCPQFVSFRYFFLYRLSSPLAFRLLSSTLITPNNFTCPGDPAPQDLTCVFLRRRRVSPSRRQEGGIQLLCISLFPAVWKLWQPRPVWLGFGTWKMAVHKWRDWTRNMNLKL